MPGSKPSVDAVLPYLKETAGGVVVALRVQPKASRSGVRGVHGGAVKVSVTEAPEKGKANRAVIEVSADALGVSKSRITVVSGETSHDKQVLVAGMGAREAAEKIKAALG
jgi:uncharacterized protein (TIGR00251 family)